MSNFDAEEILSETDAKKEFQRLKKQYFITLDIVRGTGNSGQTYIESEHENLQNFALKYNAIYPNLKLNVPVKQQCENHFMGGVAYGMALMGDYGKFY